MITCVTGQDAPFLVEMLRAKGYALHGRIRRSSSISTHRIHGICQDAHEDDGGKAYPGLRRLEHRETTWRPRVFVGNGILFNHESERRDKTFVARTISCTVVSPSTRRAIDHAEPSVYTTESASTKACRIPISLVTTDDGVGRLRDTRLPVKPSRKAANMNEYMPGRQPVAHSQPAPNSASIRRGMARSSGPLT